jgi:hypothetical protein
MWHRLSKLPSPWAAPAPPPSGADDDEAAALETPKKERQEPRERAAAKKTSESPLCFGSGEVLEGFPCWLVGGGDDERW